MKLTARILLVLFVLSGVSALMYIIAQGHSPWEKIPRSFLSVNPLNYKPLQLDFPTHDDVEVELSGMFLEDFDSKDSTEEVQDEWDNPIPVESSEKTPDKSVARLAVASKTPSIERCKNILQKLWAKQGGERMPNIRIADISAFGKPAEYNTVKKEIVIDPRAYQLCLEVSNQKDDALAFLIAHELVHSYQHKTLDYTSPGFFVKHKTLKSWAKEQREKRKNMESQADVWGAILCYLCGYKVNHVIPEFIESLYTSFNLAEEDPLYDSKKERLEIAKRAQKRAKKSIELFDMANYLTLLQEYDKAIYVYDYLLEEFKSAEFYNNRGLAYTRIGMGKLGEPFSQLDYPFLIDTETQLDKSAWKSRQPPAKFLNDAIDSYSQAIALNSGYPAARVNRAIAYHLLAQVETLRRAEHLNKAKQDLLFVHRLTFGKMGVYTSNLSQIKNSARKVAQMLPLQEEDLLQHAKRNFRPLSPADHPAVIDGINFTETYALNNVRFDWENDLSYQNNAKVSGKKLRHSFLTILETHNQVIYLQKMEGQIASLNTRGSNNLAQVGQKIPPSMRERLRESTKDSRGNYFLIDDLKGVVYKLSSTGRVLEWVIFGG